MIVERRIQDRRLRAECSSANATAAADVLGAFERLSGSGAALRAGTQIRFGWSALRLVNDGDALRVSEPAFSRWPEQLWLATIDVTVDILAAQTSLLRRLQLDGDDAYFDQQIVGARGALSKPNIFLRRGAAVSPEDSGWLLAAVDDPEALSRDDLESVLIASLVERRPALLQALVLPAGFIAIFSGEVVEQILDSAGRSRLPSRESTP